MCTCEKWRELGFSYLHAMAACFRCDINSMMLIALEYTFFTYQITFSVPFHPLRDPKYWLEANLRLSIIGDQWQRKISEPLKIIRIRNQMDRRCPDTLRWCSNYLQSGHSAPNCPYHGYFHK